MAGTPVLGASRESGVTDAFLSLARALVADYEISDLYTTLTTVTTDLLEVASAGLLLAGPEGKLGLAAASSEHAGNLELFLLQCEQGPCLDCFRDGVSISVPDLSEEEARWPRFVPTAVEAGFRSVHALPMHLREVRLGTLGLFGSTPGALSAADLGLAQALADVASVALVANRAAMDRRTLTDQLQNALNSRVVLEQAKGKLSQLSGGTVEQAFDALRRYSRDHNERLAEVARRVVARELAGEQVLEHARSRGVG